MLYLNTCNCLILCLCDYCYPDEDDELRPTDSSLKSPVPMHSRESWAEVDDIVPDLVSHRKKHPFTQQSDADSAIDVCCDISK